MFGIHHLCLVLAVFGLFACAPQYLEAPRESHPDVPRQRAWFADPPDVIHRVLRDRCSGPANRFVQVAPARARCVTLPTPETAAVLMGRYNTGLAVPLLVVEWSSAEASSGHWLDMSYYVEITDKSGLSAAVALPDSRMNAQIAAFLRQFGGHAAPGFD